MKKLTCKLSTGLTAGVLLAGEAPAHAGFGGTTFDKTTAQILTASQNVPSLITTVAYIAGLGLGVLGVLKLKQHVDNPGQTPLKDGLIRLGVGGGLLAFPFLLDAMAGSVASGGTGVGYSDTATGVTPIPVP